MSSCSLIFCIFHFLIFFIFYDVIFLSVHMPETPPNFISTNRTTLNSFNICYLMALSPAGFSSPPGNLLRGCCRS